MRKGVGISLWPARLLLAALRAHRDERCRRFTPFEECFELGAPQFPRIGAKGPVAIGDAALIFAIGVVLIALPAYLVQRAIHLVSPLFVAVAGAVGPFIVFALQGVEGRVSYSNWTLTGLIGYSLASLILAAGEAHTRPAKVPPHRWHVRR
jgi:hypothetical protein